MVAAYILRPLSISTQLFSPFLLAAIASNLVVVRSIVVASSNEHDSTSTNVEGDVRRASDLFIDGEETRRTNSILRSILKLSHNLSPGRGTLSHVGGDRRLNSGCSSSSGKPAHEYMPDNVCVQSNPGSTYYVATNGMDSNSGSSFSPFRTLAKGVSVLQAGDTLIVRAGTYTPTADIYKNIDITKSGTSSNYIVIKSEEGGARPVIVVSSMNGVQIWNSQYLEFRGFEVRGMDPDPAPINPNDTNQNGNGISVFGNVGNKFIRVIDNHVHHVGGNGIGVSNSDQVLVAGNKVWHTAHRSYAGNSGIAITGPKNFYSTTNYGMVVAENLVYDVENLYPCSCYNYQQITDGNGIIFDYYTNGDRNTYSKRVLAVNNVVHSNGGRGIHAFNFHDVDILFNTAYGNLRTPVLASAHGEYAFANAQGIRLYNNIAQPTHATYALTFFSNTFQGKAKFNILNGLIYDNNLGGAISNNLINADPLFTYTNFGTNYDLADFSIQSGSPAADYATTMLGTYPVDFVGFPRPVGNGYDLGAYEVRIAIPTPTASPATTTLTELPTSIPTVSPIGSTFPPTRAPTAVPISSPIVEPTELPTDKPTVSPIDLPTTTPIVPTDSPTVSATGYPMVEPTDKPTDKPSYSPTKAPVDPTKFPTNAPTPHPTNKPTSARVTYGPTPTPVTPAPVSSSAYEYIPDAIVTQSGTGTTYYVKPSGNDNASGISVATAFQTLKKGVNVLTEGDTLLVLDGTYEEYDGTKNLFVSKHGNSVDWIVIAAYPGHSPAIRVSTNNGIELMSCRYVEFRGFEITGQGGWSHHGISVFKGWNGPSAFVRIVENVIHHTGSHGIAASGTDQLLILRNEVHSCTSGSWQAGIHLSNPENVHTTSYPYGIAIAENRVHDNLSLNGGEGIMLGWSTGTYTKRTLVTNNLLYGNGARGIFVNNFYDAAILQNTIYGNTQTPNYASYGEITVQSDSRELDILGNVVHSTTSSHSIMGAFGAYGTIDYNVLFGASSNSADPIQEDMFTVGPLNIIGLNPLMMNPSAGDFRLQIASPAVDAGASLESGNIDVDFEQSVRPKGTAADVGAYESF